MGVSAGLKQAVAAEANEPKNQAQNLSNLPTAGSQLASRVTGGDGSLRQRLTGDPTSPFDRMANTSKDLFGNPETGDPGVYGKFKDSWKQMGDAWAKRDDPIPPGTPPDKADAIRSARTARAVQATVGALMGVLNLAQDMMNMAFADLTAPLAAIMPPFPAATLLAPFLASLHTHAHPPSLIPPAPPIPLPGIGMVTTGVCVKVLISGIPAARCGDFGLNFGCGSTTPIFEVFLGSSNVFIGGKRAARMLVDLSVCCKQSIAAAVAGKLMSALGKAADVVAKASGVAKALSTGMAVVGAAGLVVGGTAGVVAEYEESKVEDDAAMSAAKGLAAAMDAAQMASDIAGMAMGMMMGKDPAVAPPAGFGALMLGVPNVLIGGFPMINIPNPIEAILNVLGHFKPRGGSDGHGGSKAGLDED